MRSSFLSTCKKKKNEKKIKKRTRKKCYLGSDEQHWTLGGELVDFGVPGAAIFEGFLIGQIEADDENVRRFVGNGPNAREELVGIRVKQPQNVLVLQSFFFF